MPGNPFDTTIFAGELRRRIQFQNEVIGTDEMGGQQKSWVTVATVWAKIENLSGRELTDASQIYPEVDTRFTTRWQPWGAGSPSGTGLSQATRILDQYGNQYDILNIADMEDKHIKLDIMAVLRPVGRDA